jgi:RNA polymerase sigma-70 factor (ECF subfamily)
MSTSPRDEGAAAAALVTRAKAGDTLAFSELVRRYRKRIFALALHLTSSASDADDIAQDVFLQAYRALDTFEGRSEFFTWVYRMAVNRSLNKRRDRGRRGEVDLDDPRIDFAVAVDARGNPALEAELRQTYAILLRALDALPTAMRTSVVLVALQGMSHGEVAVVQKCPVGTIAWHMHEARKQLHTALAAHAGARPKRRALSISTELARLLDEFGLPQPANATPLQS